MAFARLGTCRVLVSIVEKRFQPQSSSVQPRDLSLLLGSNGVGGGYDGEMGYKVPLVTG